MNSCREERFSKHHPGTAHVSATFGAHAEKVYRALLRQQRWRVPDLADALTLDETELRLLIGELRTEGLVAGSADFADAVRAVEPGLVTTLLSLRRERRTTRRPTTAPATGRSVTLDKRFVGRSGEWTCMDGMDEVTTLIEQLVMHACVETILLTPSYLPGSFEFQPQIGETVLRRGAQLKAVWGAEVLDSPEAVKHVRSLSSRWPAPRATTAVDARAVIIDRRIAVVLGEPGQAQLLTKGPALEELLSHTDYAWEHSIALRSPTEPRGAEQRPRHEIVLQLLAEGLTDQTIARRIGVSVRTVRGDVALIMNSLGVRSRFQAGARAGRLGLLPS